MPLAVLFGFAEFLERGVFTVAFDGIFLNALLNEIKSISIGAKVDKVYQPQSDCLVLLLRSGGESKRLLLSASANAPRLHFTDLSFENPASPPMFCMLLRKHLAGARLCDIQQQGFERIAVLVFEGFDDFGERTLKKLHIEIMGRHSNIIFTDANNKIIDSIKRVDLTVSAQRQVLPGMLYSLPPAQNKLDIAQNEDFKGIVDSLPDMRTDKALLESFQGFSPLIARELSFLCCGATDTLVSDLTEAQRDKLAFFLSRLSEKVKNKSYTPVILHSLPDKKPFEFSFTNIHQYGASMLSDSAESFSALLDSFYETREKISRIHQKTSDILKILSNAQDRIIKKTQRQKLELEQSAECEKFKLYGDLLSANLYRLQKAHSVKLENIFGDGELISIELNPSFSPAQNAQKYYKEYKKRLNSAEYLKSEIEKGIEELKYLDSVLDSLTKVETEKEIGQIRQELYQSGYIKRASTINKRKEKEVMSPMHFTSSDGFEIFVGKNNFQNDWLTLKWASKTDIWLHVKDFAGSHVIVKAKEDKVSEQAIFEAAQLAAFYSKASKGTNVPVDFALVKHVKKPSGAKAGMVIYTNNKTLFVTPKEPTK